MDIALIIVGLLLADEGTLAHAVEAAFAAAAPVHRLMSVHRSDSDISKVNRMAWQQPSGCEPDELLHEGWEAHGAASFATLLAVGSALSLHSFAGCWQWRNLLIGAVCVLVILAISALRLYDADEEWRPWSGCFILWWVARPFFWCRASAACEKRKCPGRHKSLALHTTGPAAEPPSWRAVGGISRLPGTSSRRCSTGMASLNGGEA